MKSIQPTQSGESNPAKQDPDGPSSKAAGIVGGICLIIVGVACLAAGISSCSDDTRNKPIQVEIHPLIPSDTPTFAPQFPANQKSSKDHFSTKFTLFGIAFLVYGITWLFQGLRRRRSARL